MNNTPTSISDSRNTSSELAIKIENLSKLYKLGLVSAGTIGNDITRFWAKLRGKDDPFIKIGETNDRTSKGISEYVLALKNINLEVKRGERIGIIGKNGAGKSTLLKILSEVTGPTKGKIKMRGRVGSLLEVGTGFHGELTGRENIYMNGTILGMSHKEVSRKLDEIVDFAGVERYIDTPVKRYSSGMTVRLGFAVAAHLEPDILIVDEVLAVGDAEFQKKAIGKMKDVSEGDGKTILFVSHNMHSVELLCSKGIVIDNGEVVFEGTQIEAIEQYSSIDYDVKSEVNLMKREDRIGTGEIRFSGYRIVNKNGEVQKFVHTGQSFKVEFDLKVINADAKYLNKINFSFSLMNNKGVVLFVNHSSLYDKTFSIDELKQKERIVLDIKDFPIVPGEYIINFNMVQGYTYIDGYNEGFKLDIRSGYFLGEDLKNRPGDGNILINAVWTNA